MSSDQSSDYINAEKAALVRECEIAASLVADKHEQMAKVVEIIELEHMKMAKVAELVILKHQSAAKAAQFVLDEQGRRASAG